jgi:hypothetical protein
MLEGFNHYKDFYKDKLNSKNFLTNSRNWYYYPIPMPVDINNCGPCNQEDCVIMKYEVWDRDMNTYASYDDIYSAINKAIELNNMRILI